MKWTNGDWEALGHLIMFAVILATLVFVATWR
jgi:hypothetical protein